MNSKLPPRLHLEKKLVDRSKIRPKMSAVRWKMDSGVEILDMR
jgi:hypothetical protein